MNDPPLLPRMTLTFEREGMQCTHLFHPGDKLSDLVQLVEYHYAIPALRQRWYIQDIGIIRPRPNIMDIPLDQIIDHEIYLYGGPGQEEIDWDNLDGFLARKDNELGFSWESFRGSYQNQNLTLRPGGIVHPLFDIDPRPFDEANEIIFPLTAPVDDEVALQTNLDVDDMIGLWDLIEFRRVVGDYIAMHHPPRFHCEHSFTGNYNMEDETCSCQANHLLQWFVFLVRLFQYAGRMIRYSPPVFPGSSDASNKRFVERIAESCRMKLTFLYIEWLDGLKVFNTSPFHNELFSMLSIVIICGEHTEAIPSGFGRRVLTYECIARSSEEDLELANTILDAVNMTRDYRVFYGPRQELPVNFDVRADSQSPSGATVDKQYLRAFNANPFATDITLDVIRHYLESSDDSSLSDFSVDMPSIHAADTENSSLLDTDMDEPDPPENASDSERRSTFAFEDHDRSDDVSDYESSLDADSDGSTY